MASAARNLAFQSARVGGGQPPPRRERGGRGRARAGYRTRGGSRTDGNGCPWQLPWDGWLPAALVALIVMAREAMLPRRGAAGIALGLAATAVALGGLLLSTLTIVQHAGINQWPVLPAGAFALAAVLVLAIADRWGRGAGELARMVGHVIAAAGTVLLAGALIVTLSWANVLLVLALLVPVALAARRYSTAAPAAGAVSLLIALLVYLHAIGPWNASESHPVPVLAFWLVLAWGALIVSRHEAGERIAGGVVACVSNIVLVLLVAAQVDGAWGYVLLAMLGIALLLLGLVRRAPAFAAWSLLLVLAAPVCFHWDWLRGQLMGYGFLDLVLPAFLVGLALAFWERLALARWRDVVVPGAADLSLLFHPRFWQHVVAATVAVFGIVVAVASELFGMTVLSAGWTVVASLLLAFGFMAHAAIYRRYGMALLALVVLRVLLVDTAQLETPVKIVAWLGLGAALLVFGFIYAQYKDRMARWL